MDCPVCQSPMNEEDFGGARVDVCKDGCKGIWFDWSELEKLDEEHEGIGLALKEALESDRHKDDNRGQINCPKCNNAMVAHLYKSAKEITVDECYQCGGFYLDSGELEIIRDNFMSDEQRDQFVKSLVEGMPEYGKANADLEKQKQRTEAIRKMTKFLRPSDLFRKN